MRDLFLEILNNYTTLYNSPFRPTEYDLARRIKYNSLDIISNQVTIDESKYKVEGSVGLGKWTDTPWIGIFDKHITETAQKGFYIVYLFCKDMSGIYLSLNQGTTYIEQKYSNKKPREKMKLIAEKIRENLEYKAASFPITQIDLRSNTNRAKNYMAAHICGKFYPVNNIPGDEQLASDLYNLINIYSQLKDMIGSRSTERMIDYLLTIEELEDTQFQSDVLLANPTRTSATPQNKPLQSESNRGQKWQRNASVAKEALQNADYKCEFNPEHETFISDLTGENFVEAHHLIPMNLQNEFQWSLDVPGNIVALCPNCHRKIHHAKKPDKASIIKKLYAMKKQQLLQYGIDISLDELIKVYN